MFRPIHFEIPTDDPERARAFYQAALGWQSEAWDGPMPYWLVNTGEGDGINGGLFRRDGGFPVPCLVVDVPDADAATTRVTAAGGTIAMPKTAIPGMGWTVYAKDTEGNVFGMMQFDPAAG